MKQWKWFGYIAVAALTICAVAILLAGKQTCRLCNSPNYSAPCLVDLETGDILELRLVGPSTSNSTGSSIPAETFSFIRFGNVTGSRRTPDRIELKIPSKEKVKSLALCNKCCNLLPSGYDDRYVLADLDSDTLFFFVDGEIRIRNCAVSMTQKDSYFVVVICL